jgi:hypothetical protein
LHRASVRAHPAFYFSFRRGSSVEKQWLDCIRSFCQPFCAVVHDTDNTEALALDLRARIVNRPQITSDGYTPYPNAVAQAFQTDVDYAVLTKKYVGDSNEERLNRST